jgi:hypothetical protein
MPDKMMSNTLGKGIQLRSGVAGIPAANVGKPTAQSFPPRDFYDCHDLRIMPKNEPGSGFTPGDARPKKKPYSSPSLVELDLNAVKIKLEAKGNPKDPIAQKMLSFVDEQLNRRKAQSH